MRTFREILIHWDNIFLNGIFRLNHRRWLLRPIPLVSRSGDGYLYPVIALAFWLADRNPGGMLFFSALAAFAIELPLYKLVKHIVRRCRPCDALCAIERRIQAPDRFSFPSGHTAGAFLMANIVSTFFPFTAPYSYTWATAVGFSRIHLGMHYPTDVLAGILLGICCAEIGVCLVI